MTKSTQEAAFRTVIGAELSKCIGDEIFLSFGHNDHGWCSITEVKENKELETLEVVIGGMCFTTSLEHKFQVRKAVVPAEGDLVRVARVQTEMRFKLVSDLSAQSRAMVQERLELLSMRADQATQPHYPLTDVYQGFVTDIVDDYELTMAYAHWKKNTHNDVSVFHYYFRTLPFKGGYAITSGLSKLLDFITHYKWSEAQLAKVATATGNDGKLLYEPAFIDYLRNMKLTVDVDAVKEGSVVFANEPVVRIKGAIAQCYMLESAILNFFNFGTLGVTKAARIVYAANGAIVSDQSLRRDQGVDGALTAAWNAFLGGFGSTSNRMATRIFNIPCKGTMAHAFVMAHAEEIEAFLNFADAMPNNCIFLVDTYNSIAGIKKAIKVALMLRERGYKAIGIRLDSGDLAYLSKEARQMCDESGLPEMMVFCSNDLDEYIIMSLRAQGSRINAYGVGTKSGTCYDQPALGGVYKLGAKQNAQGEWEYGIKLSEDINKTSTPGIQQTRRFMDANGKFIASCVYNELSLPRGPMVMIDQKNPTRKRKFAKSCYGSFVDMLVPIMRAGKVVYVSPTLPQLQAFVKDQLSRLDDSHKRFDNPHEFPVGLENGLFKLKERMIKQGRARAEREAKAA